MNWIDPELEWWIEYTPSMSPGHANACSIDSDSEILLRSWKRETNFDT